MIRFLKPEEVLPLRSKVLRNGKPLADCVFQGDTDESTLHLGISVNEELVGIATFMKQDKSGFKGSGYQLRGMATDPDFQGKGYGNQLLNAVIVYFRKEGIDYLWCNARKVAYKFYLSLGFEFISEEFELQEIGSHREMYLRIR